MLWKILLFGYEYYSSPAIGSDGTLYIGTSKSTFFQNHIKNLIAISDPPNSLEDEQEIIYYSPDQNYPNPFNPTTNIQYSISSKQFITLKVYDVLGIEVATLVNEGQPAGSYEVEFNAESLPSGIYFYQLRAGDFVETKKMVYLK